MRKTGFTILCNLFLISSCWGAEEYSFESYLAGRGGCSAHRQILDERLNELRFNFVSPGRSSQNQGIDLFGRAAADWTERDIQGVLAAFRRCEEQIFRNSLDRPGQQARKAMTKDYELLIARGAARIEATLREIIAAGRTAAGRANPQAAGDGRGLREDAGADRWNRQGAAPSATEKEPEPARTRSPGEGDPERARRAEIQSERLQEARRVARDRERDRMRAELAPPGSRAAPPESAGQARPAEALAFAPRPIVDRNNCVVTREGFDQVQRGMALDRVEAVIGCRGNLTTTTISADLGKVETHLWEDRKANGTITVQFLNGLVYTKSQVGLN